jgi:3-methyladenine DNA glycosylase AlkC
MEPLKNMFDLKFYTRLAAEFRKVYPAFNKERFLKDVVKGQEERSLIQRMRHAVITLHDYLPQDYPEALSVLLKVAPAFRSHFTSFLFPDFVGLYGHEHTSLSLNALKELTQYGSSEFAIREFLKRDLKGTLKTMYKWADDKNHHVRRLASEGCRPRLPWSFNIEAIAKDPELTRPILEKLKGDEVLYIKKSVANHLNDFSRIDPEWMLSVVSSWDGKNPHTAWIIRHASRSLIKKGHAGSLRIFNYEKDAKVKIEKFRLSSSKLRLGDTLQFSFEMLSEKKRTQKLVVDYAVHYSKSGGTSSKKVFKLKEAELAAGEKVSVSKKQTFKDFSTRKHYTGTHAIEIIVNGRSLVKKEFHLAVSQNP